MNDDKQLKQALYRASVFVEGKRMIPKLIIFDLDGTLSDRDTDELLPGVADWFAANKDKHRFAIASNQGGVGLRYWMETNRFGEPDKFPTHEEIQLRLRDITTRLDVSLRTYVCYAYQSKTSGQWSPVPPDQTFADEWKPDHRKPAPGMLNSAMRDTGVAPVDTLYVGDSYEDVEAARAADVGFMYAYEFFGREKP